MVSDLDSFSHYLKKETQSIQNSKEKSEYVIGVCFVLLDLMKKSKIDNYLKQKILYNYLFPLFDHKSWKVRYLITDAMLQWIEKGNHEEYARNLTAKLAEEDVPKLVETRN